MKQRIKITPMKLIPLFLLFLLCSVCCHDAVGGAEENELSGEMMRGIEESFTHYKKRKQALKELVRKPLSEAQEKLLRQLLKHTGALDHESDIYSNPSCYLIKFGV